ncbi:MAG: sigma-70 family RNA polymerase sigma factor [Myxococcota bacterium]
MDLDVHLPAIAAGDPTAFARWLAGAEEPLRLGLRSFATAVDVEAVLQEALLRVWQVAGRFTPDGRPNALLRLAVRVARNAAIDELRRTRATPVDAAALERLDAAIEPDPLLRTAIATCRDALPAQPRTAFDARLAGGSDEALAEAAGMKLNTFLKNVGRARTLLLACLRRAGVVLEVA